MGCEESSSNKNNKTIHSESNIIPANRDLGQYPSSDNKSKNNIL